MKAKKRTKQVCGIAAVILATLLLLIGSFIYATRYRISEHDTAASPDGRLESLAVREPEAYEPVSEEVNFDKTTTESSDTLVPNTADILAANSAESSEELPVFSGQDLGELLAESVPGKMVQTTGEEKAGIEAELREIGKLCRADYLQAEKIPSEYLGQDNIEQEDRDAMEAVLFSAGYCVENSDAVYSGYLENAEKLIQFWDDVSKEQDAAATVWGIAPSGLAYCRVFQFAHGKGYCIHASG